MQLDKNHYHHLPMQGLPKSLVQIEGGTVAVITLMQRQAGLNRERRRYMQSGTKLTERVDQFIPDSISKTDRNILSFYLSASERWGSFWHVALRELRQLSTARTNAYVVAVDVQLLNAYDPEWRTLTLDIDVLTRSCPEWERIRKSIERGWERKEKKEKMPHGVFMLWPRLATDLRQWETLNIEQRTRVGHAVFSLSSIGWTHWFIDEALSICPDLEFELGELSTSTILHSDSETVTTQNTFPLQGESGIDTTAAESTLDVTSTLLVIGQSLTQLESEWQTPPTRVLINRLIALGNAAADVLNAMPEDILPQQNLLERRLNTLRNRLMEAIATGELTWLGADDVNGIMASWDVALADAQSGDSILQLADDAELAMSRLATALDDIKTAQECIDKARQVVDMLDEELMRQPTAVRRIELNNRQFQAKEAVLAAERKHTDTMRFVLASVSPMGAAYRPEFDHSSPFAECLQNELAPPLRNDGYDAISQALSDAQIVNEADKAAQGATEREVSEAIAQPKKVTIQESSPMEEAEKPLETSETDSEETALSIGVLAPTDGRTERASLAQLENIDAVVHQKDFSVTAGDQCRPIWSLLKMGRPSLSYQYAYALHEAFPETRVPPLALLRSVALAPGLIAGDGPLAMSIGEAFGEINPVWFEPEDTPSNWHTALNLMLIAATLRPMVLAPAMGAAAIAGYRHLDRRYLALLELVRLVGEVSEPLTGFSIGPTVLRSAADEASQKAQLKKLSKDAEDWLLERAPSKKIRYAPASKVWLHWLRPGGAIYNLISPVAQSAVAECNSVRALVEEFVDYDAFLERVRETDRRQLDRRGQDIEAGALEHLWIATCEAVALAKEWLGAESMLSESGGRLRTLIGRLQAAFSNHAKQACEELCAQRDDDQWGQIDAASYILRTEILAISDMFRQSDVVPSKELQAKELLARDLLLVPSASVAEDWSIQSDGVGLLNSLDAWVKEPTGVMDAFDARLKVGDLAGASVLLQDMPGGSESGDQQQSIERAGDQWAKELQQKIQHARRASEVGLAYGYLSDDERTMCEGELSSVELFQRDTDRFDLAMVRVESVVQRIDEQKNRRIQQAHAEFTREKGSLSDDVVRQVEAPLARSDIHTFNELMQRVRQGLEPWPERYSRQEAFGEFFPKLQTELLGILVQMDPADVDKEIRQGGVIGPLSFDLEADEQARQDAEEVYTSWAVSRAKKSMSRDNLRKVLNALGVTVRVLDQGKHASEWLLQTTPIVDREVCPVPYFGSRAQGRYRVIVMFDRSTAEDLLQRIGDSSQQTATIVFFLSRSIARFWPELARLSKERQRSFLLLDESILLFLLAQQGSRLATWFNIALPFTYNEPYDASAGFVPPEMFYGRASELELVKDQGGCYFIYGGRQLGKTALLRRAEKTFHDPSAGHYAVWIDLLSQGIGERRPAVDVWLSMFEKLRELNIPGLDMPSVNPTKPASIDAFLTSIKMFLVAKPGRRILLLLDEADHFFEQDARQGGAYAETRRLKQLMDETDRQFKVVFAGLHNVLRTASTSNQPLGHLNEAVRIGPLMDEREIRAAEELITRPVESAGFEFDDRSLVMRVLAQTNYYPSLIQLYCTQLLRHLRETKMKRQDAVGPRFKIHEADIESVFSGRPLRDAIRSKFRLTLQLDDRYEVIAYAIGLEALSHGYYHAQGIDWRKIRQDCASSWWPEGFETTSERDFLALLEEMVQLGVLSQAKTAERFSLRNPNVLLLLGSKQEIESTLQAEREPRIVFESTIFRPIISGRVDDPARNPLTYRQLDEVVQMRSTVSLVAASNASGINNLLPGLQNQPGLTDNRLFIQLDSANDLKGFVQELDKETKKRVADSITVMLVPQTVSWTTEWVSAAQTKIKSLTSTRSYVSVVFVADPKRLWALAPAVSEQGGWKDPWLTVLPWARGFVRKWLEELQLPIDSVDRLEIVTGFWGGLLESAVQAKGGALDFANNLERLTELRTNSDWLRESRGRLTGGIAEAEAVLFALQGLGDGVSESDLVEFGDLSLDVVKRTLCWAEPLGLVFRLSGGAWALDSFAKRVFGDLGL